MAQQLRALSALSGDQGSIPTPTWQLTPGSDTLTVICSSKTAMPTK